MLIDVHCHFFTKNILTDTTISFLKSISRRGPVSGIKNGISSINMENFISFINAGADSTPIKIYQEMAEAYQEEFIAVPLMLDLTYASQTDNEKKLNEDTFDHNRQLLIRFLKTKINPQNEGIISNIISKLNGYTLLLGNNKAYFRDSLLTQINELTEIKKTHGDRVYPFFSVDPRHKEGEDGILSLIKKYVGPGKPFTGIKLYTPLGYSPTDPVLYHQDRQVETVYQWCEKNHIPVTVHFADQGFSNFLCTHTINGHVYFPEAGRPVLAKDLFEDSIIRYNTSFPASKYNEFVKERAISLNHPSLWRMVLEQYPALKINFAHFGGSRQIHQYLNHSTLAYWTKSVLEMMHDYKNVYSDVSYFETSGQSRYSVQCFYENIFLALSKKEKERVLFGSDYYMLILIEKNLSLYLEKFKKGFSEDFHKIAHENPSAFLNL